MATVSNPPPYEQIQTVYKQMVETLDVGGELDGPELDARAKSFAKSWLEQEKTGAYQIGLPDYSDAPAFVFIVQAAKQLAVMNYETSIDMLHGALALLEDAPK